ncbi:MAG: nucleotidyltransferase domain-containing protein [Anaerolineales bacterium]|jgi:predicted nucleotidyltransferase|nr:nucleotidyltransferase domain-containing protein [Anaerolineales bacterium]
MGDIALSVPPITVRDRIPFAAIQDVVEQIAGHFKPIRIILFGSYAYGQPKPESDVDLLVIMDTPLNETQQAVEILKTIAYRFGLDLLVYTPQHLQQRLEWGDPFLREIVDHGKVLYASTGN